MPVFPTSTSHAWRFRIRRRPAAIAACTAFLLTAALTASAHAQIDVSEETGLDLDTGWTPVAKETPLWQQLGGAEFGSNRATKGSPTPAELDLFDVAFLDELNGIAGGAECADHRDPIESCERVPVIYRYLDPDGEGPEAPTWEEAARFPGQGYVGSIAWIGPGRALAVGGDGEYPRREPAFDAGGQGLVEPYGAQNDLAGMGRAFLYEDGAWRELRDLPDGTSDDEIPAEMRGMSALDCTPRPETDGELCVAGALGQLWHWREGAFEPEPFDHQSSEQRMEDAPLLRFRVREIRFAPGDAASFTSSKAQIAAVTSGCCAEDELQNAPRVLVYRGGRWEVRVALDARNPADLVEDADGFGGVSSPLDEESATDAERAAMPRTTLPDSYYSFVLSGPFQPLATAGGPPSDAEPASVLEDARGFTKEKASWDPSCKSSLDTLDDGLPPPLPSGVPSGVSTGQLTALANYILESNLGRFAANCPSGTATGYLGTTSEVASEPSSLLRPVTNLSRTRIGTARLVVVDQSKIFVPEQQMTVVDTWALGSLRSGQAVALGPATDQGYLVEAGGQEIEDPRPKGGPAAGLWPSVPHEGIQRSQDLYALPSNALNALDMVGLGSGWAVGDRGAILRYDNEGVKIQAGLLTREEGEPDPPTLGSRARDPGAARAAYEPFRPPAAGGEIGEVPSLWGSAVERAPYPRLVAAGTAPGGFDPLPGESNPLGTIVMSRDGSEGWTITISGRSLDLYHYDGVSWSFCDPVGIPGELPPDPACAALAPLKAAGVTFSKAIRVPLENDGDPTNDDEFEVLAFGTSYRERPDDPARDAVIRYRRGRWELDSTAMEQMKDIVDLDEVIFTTPDDALALKYGTGAVGVFNEPIYYHFNGTRWIKCSGTATVGEAENCDDPRGLLPRESADLGPSVHLASAGERVYLYGHRRGELPADVTVVASDQQTTFPLILYRDRGGSWTAENGGFDPGCASRSSDFEDECVPSSEPGDEGRVESLSVIEGAEGRYEGWAAGRFGGRTVGASGRSSEDNLRDAGLGGSESAAMLRLTTNDAGETAWMAWRARDAGSDYRLSGTLITLPGALGFSAVIAGRDRPVLGFDPQEQRWEAVPTPFRAVSGPGARSGADVAALTPDGQGGFMLAAQSDLYGHSFYRYTDLVPREPFEDAPHPIRAPVSALFGGADGSLWVTAGSTLYRYDRLTGWDRLRIPGWDPPKTVDGTPVSAIAVGPDGRGVAVGRGGRIADIRPEGVGLDDAAGTVCDSAAPQPPCGTGRDLGAAAAAPDGSAMVAGSGTRSLLWRPAAAGFRRISGPVVPSRTGFADIAMPRPERAWLLTGDGEIYAGELSGAAQWSWGLEKGAGGVGVDAAGKAIPIREMAIAPDGRGYAVGDAGLILERAGDGSWRRVDAGVSENLTSLALPAGSGEGALIGGEGGLLLTSYRGGFQIARQLDPFDPFTSRDFAQVAGVALLPGVEPGQVEAWAAVNVRDLSRAVQILHYASDPGEPLLSATGGVAALPDAPAPRPGETAFAAFGKSDCPNRPTRACFEMTGTSEFHEVVSRRVVDEIVARSAEPGGPAFAVFTGDANDVSGRRSAPLTSGQQPSTPAEPSVKHHRWAELVADRFLDAGLPLFGAVGGQDLSQAEVCHGQTFVENFVRCAGSRSFGATTAPGAANVQAGLNLPWREAMAQMSPPWGLGDEPARHGSLVFEPAAGSLSVRMEDQEVEGQRVQDPDGSGPVAGASVPGARAPLGGANTHYAVDVVDEAQGQAVLRLVVVDTSLRSLSAADPTQQPLEPGGQAAWLEEVLCVAGSASDTGQCTRDPGQPAVVVSNAPTYSYAPTDSSQLQTDATAFETILMRHGVSAVVSGRLGWNGLYWATAPGVHEPCPGGDYQEEPPAPGVRVCGQGSGTDELPTAEDFADPLAAAGQDEPLSGVLPFVVSSSAGGDFDQLAVNGGFATPERGFWHGYAIVRVDASGDPRGTIVEQRPVFDWVSLDGSDRTIQPREKLALHGEGREPFAGYQLRYDALDTPAITHRYELLLADPQEPWVPCLASDSGCQSLKAKLGGGSRSFDSASGGAARSAQDDTGGVSASGTGSAQDDRGGASVASSEGPGDNPCEPYLCLPERVGTIDRITGKVKAGAGKQPRTFAIAMLSVGEHVDTYPLAFEKSPSFVVNPLSSPPGVPSPGPSVSNAPHAPPPPSVPKPNVPQPSLPELPALPGIPPLSAAQPPEPQPPAPPAPPPPSQQPSPLDLTVSPQAIAIATPTAVIQPPTPPVNPAPPGGARREARQRQAATQKSGADSSEGAEETQGLAGDLAGSRESAHGSNMTRLDSALTRTDRRRPEPSFTTYSASRDTSPWATGALYTGSLTLIALALAAGWSRGRPTPRRREPELPAPALSYVRWR